MSKTLFSWLSIGLTLLVFSSANAQRIFVWDHDNTLRNVDLVFDDERITSSDAVSRTLDALEMDYTMSEALPEDLEDFDVAMVLLGFPCFV